MLSTPRIILIIIAILLFIACAITSTILQFKLIKALNKLRPQNDQLSIYGDNSLQPLKEYKKKYPQGKLFNYQMLCYAGFALGFILAGTAFLWPR